MIELKGKYTTAKVMIDEAPACYKNCQMITNAIAPTASIKHVLQPLYNLKG
jgi:RNA-splicing ligase RtcB